MEEGNILDGEAIKAGAIIGLVIIALLFALHWTLNSGKGAAA